MSVDRTGKLMFYQWYEKPDKVSDCESEEDNGQLHTITS